MAGAWRLGETAVRRWVGQAAVDAGERDGLTTEEREELRRLRSGHPEAHDFLRDGDPMNRQRFGGRRRLHGRHGQPNFSRIRGE